MFGLCQEVRRDHLGIARAVGDDVDFRRAGQLVDPHRAEHLPLGLVHKPIAGADNLVHRRHGFGAIGHCRNCLRSADAEHAVRPRKMAPRQHCGMRAGRHAGDHLIHPRHAGRHDGHHRGRQKREPSARHIAPHPLHRDHPVAKKGTGQHLDLQRNKAGKLRLGKAAHVRNGKLGVCPGLRVKDVHG